MVLLFSLFLNEEILLRLSVSSAADSVCPSLCLRTTFRTAEFYYVCIIGGWKEGGQRVESWSVVTSFGVLCPNPIIKALLPQQCRSNERVGATKTLCVFYGQIKFWRLRTRSPSRLLLLLRSCRSLKVFLPKLIHSSSSFPIPVCLATLLQGEAVPWEGIDPGGFMIF